MSANKYLSWLAARRRISRRQFMSQAAALGISSGLTSAFAAKAGLAQEAPRKGGHLILGLDGASTSDSLDPATYYATFIYTVGFQWGNCLVELDVDNRAVPELAESWEPNDDATQWVFKIRRGVEFHNGKELTAADVVHSIDYHRGEDSHSGAKGILEPIAEIRATDTHEVMFRLTSANLDMPYLLSDYHLLIMPEGSPPDSGIGTGPYIIERFEPGVRTMARRNPNYWKEGRAHVDTVETVAINDITARMTAVQTGSAHFVNRVEPRTVPLLERVAGVSLLDVPGAGHHLFAMRCDVPPHDNLDVRLALKYAIDREDLYQKILSGFGRVGNDQPIAEFDPFYSADVPQREYDPDKARYHFEKSGAEGPINLYIADAAFTGAVDSAILFKEHAAEAGIEINVNRVPDDGYWSDTWMQQSFYGSYWIGRATADQMLSTAYQSTAAWNETFWRREDFDALLVQARGETDAATRREMYHDLQMMIWEDGGAVIPMFNNFLFARRNEVEGFVPAPVMTGVRVSEQLYFTS